MIASLITALYLGQYIPAGEAMSFLYIYGACLILAEVALVSFGLLFLNGLMAIYIAYAIQTGDLLFLGIPIEWPLVFGVAFMEMLMLAVCLFFFLKQRKLKITTGIESMIGQEATVVEWHGRVGAVLIQGENWKAVSDQSLNVGKGDEVKIEAVQGLKVKISR
jgi:membrane-bound serine protease (ClpP class)